MAELKKDWTLNPESFRKFLNWLDCGADSGGEKYLEMRGRLVRYFERRNCHGSGDLADETLNRAARKLEEKGEITADSPSHYCYIVAKYVLLESSRSADRNLKSLEETQEGLRSFAAARASQLHINKEEEADEREKMAACLERCLAGLAAEDRELILDYYRGDKRDKIERRAKLAERLGLTANALSIRACRIRDKLESCVATCREKE